MILEAHTPFFNWSRSLSGMRCADEGFGSGLAVDWLRHRVEAEGSSAVEDSEEREHPSEVEPPLPASSFFQE